VIHYALRCDQGHEFDGWFADSASFDAQAKAGLVECPHCASVKVEKQIMAPGIPVRDNRRTEVPRHGMVAGGADPKVQEALAVLRDLRREVEANADYVGERFAEEARAIHYKETEQRRIYGEATGAEAKALIEEGIEVHPLPRLPEDGN